MIDPQLMQQLMAMRQSQMGQMGQGPRQFPQMPPQMPPQMQQGGGGPPQQGGINPYIQLLMQRGMGPMDMGMRLPNGMPGPQAQAPQPSIPGWAQRQEGQARPMGPGRGQGQGGQRSQQGGGMGAYQSLVQGGQNGQQGNAQMAAQRAAMAPQMTPTGLTQLPKMGMPTGGGSGY